MTMNQDEINEAHYRGECIYPDTGEKLSDYLAGPLESVVAKEVEDHLLECLHCREFFLTVLSIRGEARMAKAASGGEEPHAAEDAKVLRFADFRKEWP